MSLSGAVNNYCHDALLDRCPSPFQEPNPVGSERRPRFD